MRFAILFAFAILLPPLLHAQTFSADSVRADLDLLRRTLIAYHPALDEFEQRDEFEDSIRVARERLSAGPSNVSMSTVMLHIVQALAVVRDGHTFVNPYNQQGAVADARDASRVLPFLFRVGRAGEDEHLIVTRDLTDGLLPSGTTVYAIDERSTSSLLDQLVGLTRGDGRGVDAQRRTRLGILPGHVLPRGWPEFDRLYPLVFGDGETTALHIQRPDDQHSEVVEVERIGQQERRERLRASGIDAFDDERAWSWRLIDDSTAYVRAGSFLSNRFSAPADSVLARLFGAVRNSGATALMFDARGVEGGTLGYEHVASYLTQRTVPCAAIDRVLLASDRADPAFFPYLRSWDEGWKQPIPAQALERLPDGRYLLRGAGGCSHVEPSPQAFGGHVVMLTDAFQTSATFLLGVHLRRSGLATLVGESLGGNRRGITGGLMVMLTLPQTGIVVDIPLLRQLGPSAPPDAPIKPDITTEWTATDVSEGRDPDIEAARLLLNANRRTNYRQP